MEKQMKPTAIHQGRGEPVSHKLGFLGIWRAEGLGLTVRVGLAAGNRMWDAHGRSTLPPAVPLGRR